MIMYYLAVSKNIQRINPIGREKPWSTKLSKGNQMHYVVPFTKGSICGARMEIGDCVAVAMGRRVD